MNTKDATDLLSKLVTQDVVTLCEYLRQQHVDIPRRYEVGCLLLHFDSKADSVYRIRLDDVAVETVIPYSLAVSTNDVLDIHLRKVSASLVYCYLMKRGWPDAVAALETFAQHKLLNANVVYQHRWQKPKACQVFLTSWQKSIEQTPALASARVGG